jgi:spore germination protein YaaH
LHLRHKSRPAAILWSVILLVLLVAAAPPDPEEPLFDTTPPKRPPVVAAWLRGPRGGMRPMVVIIAPRIGSYTDISAFSYTIERDGSLTANDPVTDAVLVDFARLNGLKVIPTISSTWEATNVSRVLKDPTLRANHINAIMKVARLSVVDGIDLDYENLAPEMRQPFTDFVSTLAGLLHREGKTLSVTVPARISNDDGCVICKFADYAALGSAADQIRIMAYEYHTKSPPPAPNAPIWWVRRVVEYAVSLVPRQKVVLGIHLYAYDWGGKETPAMWWSDVQRLRERYGGQVTFVESDGTGLVGESMLKYSIPLGQPCARFKPECVRPPREEHTVWFVDARYVALAWDIVKEYQLGGIVMWRPGGEDPDIWQVLPSPAASTN